MNNILCDSSPPSSNQIVNCKMTRFAPALLAILLPAMGMVGCVHGPHPGSHQMAHVGTFTNANGHFLTPTHLVTQTFVANVSTNVNVGTAWVTASGYTLSGETVSCFLQKVGTNSYQYCQKQTVGSQSGNTDPLTFTFKLPTGATGVYDIYTYSTGTLAPDNSNLDPLADGESQHCPGLTGEHRHRHRHHHHHT